MGCLLSQRQKKKTRFRHIPLLSEPPDLKNLGEKIDNAKTAAGFDFTFQQMDFICKRD